MIKAISFLKRVFFYFSGIALIWVVLKVIRSGVAINSGLDAETSRLSVETAQWFMIMIFWFLAFLVMKAIEIAVEKLWHQKSEKSPKEQIVKAETPVPSLLEVAAKMANQNEEESMDPEINSGVKEEYPTRNEPLDGSDHNKLVVFLMLSIATVFPLVIGIIPALVLGFGFYLMKKNQDFSSIDGAVKIVTGYAWLAAIISVIGGIVIILDWGDSDGLLGVFFGPVGAIAYLFALQRLFYEPLSSHREWVEVNGIFSKKPKSLARNVTESGIDIIKGEKLKQYSVADELLKWAKLKEDGHISDEEFKKAREKLLKNP